MLGLTFHKHDFDLALSPALRLDELFKHRLDHLKRPTSPRHGHHGDDDALQAEQDAKSRRFG